VDIRLRDDDGSEILSDIVIGKIPAGATIVNAGGVAIGVNLGGGEVRLQASQLADLHILPPANSSADFQLTVTASATESSQGLSGDGDVAIGTTTLNVSVTGVADAPSLVAAPLVIAEGQPVALGSAISATLADTDGSETLFFVIEGLPAGITPSVGNFIGGKWQIAAGDIAGLTLSAAANFSGDYVSEFATDLKVLAVTQENDGHQTVTQVPLDITVTPTVDGALWTPAVQISEGANLSLSAAAPLNLIDTDGSEIIVDYTFDLNSFIASAGVSGSVSTTQDLIDSHITGVFTDNGNGTITIEASDLSSISINQTALVDSNLGFAIPFTVRFNDAGVVATVSKSLAVDVVGVADLPTVFAVDVSGHANTPLPLSLGGTTTDIDISLGRAQSEEIYYVVSGFAGVGVDVALTDSTGSPVGLNNGDGTWVLQTSDLADLHVTAAQGQTGNRTLTVTTVATENDGDRAMASVNFDVTITHGGGIGIPVLPKMPLVDIRVMATSEDNPAILDVEILVDPTDLTTSLADITVVLSDIPSGAEVSGAIYNPVTGNWVTTALNINTGAVIFTPAADFSGILNFTLAAVATTGPLASVVNAANAGTIVVLPVTDTPLITISGAGSEDNATPLAITVGVSDIDGSETIIDPIRITLSHGTLSAGNHLGGGVWEITLAQLSGLTLTTDPHFSGDVSVTVEATARELTGSTASLSASATVQVDGIADQATISVAASAGVEDSAINLVGLGASLVDLDGSETLTTIITGIPDGTILSAGANNGDESWTVAAADLATLSLTPPQNWSGVMNLELVAFTRESSGHTSEIRRGFTITVDAVADPVVFMALPVTAAVGVATALNLQLISGDDTSAGGSENPAEIMVVDLQAATHFITTTTGGLLECLSLGHWRFIGTEAEANLLGIAGYGAPRELNLTVSAFARDGASEGTPSTQNLTVSLTGNGQTLEGSVAADTLSGGNGADLLRGAGGADILSGGAGADLFIWADGDLAGGVTDIISDFSQSEDVLDLSALITSYDPATESVSDYISLVETAGNTFVRIDTSGSGTFTVDAIELTAVTGLDLTAMIATGALIA
jgi:Ca2+-binding RTX toxin-like protein